MGSYYSRDVKGLQQAAADAIGANFRNEVRAGLQTQPRKGGGLRTFLVILAIAAVVAAGLYIHG